MIRTVLAPAALLVIAAIGCGGGVDGKPIPPATTPEPAAGPVAPPAPPPPPAACTDQRDRALAYSYGHSQVVHEWEAARPIRFRVETAPIVEGGLRIGRPNFLEEEVLHPLGDMARRLEERLGYPIMDLDGPPGGDGYTVTVRWRDHVWSPGWSTGTGPDECPSHVGSPWNAQSTPPAVFMNRYFFNPEIICYRRDRDAETIIHELAHVFGMGHATGSAPWRPGDLQMSAALTVMRGWESDSFLTLGDIDNIGCIFPHPDFPR